MHERIIVEVWDGIAWNVEDFRTLCLDYSIIFQFQMLRSELS
jgi:hypothetical protein